MHSALNHVMAVDCVETQKNMVLHVSRYVALLFVLVSCSCSLHKTTTVQPNPPVPDTRQPAVAEENDPQAGLALNDAVSDTVSEENKETVPCPDGVDCSTPAHEDSQGVLSEQALPEETPANGDMAYVENADISGSEENGEKGQALLDTALDLVNSAQEYWAEGDPDQAIAVLDEAYSLVVKVDTDETPSLFQQKEDLRYMISKRILEIYASRYTATNGNHNEIPLTINEYVEKEIKRFQGREHRFFIESYQRSGRYMPMILEALNEAGLPEDLAWLPLIESGFKVNALSKARALGLWQFIASTGQKFGLKRDTWVDERLDPEKATAAAIAYLKELHQIFGDWTTVLAGYNCGEGAVLRRIRRQKVNYLDNFWDLFQMLPSETAQYVPRFLATLHILNDPAGYGFDLEEPYSPVAYETVTIKKPVQLSAVADKIGVSEKELSELNPELRHKATPPTTYVLKVPEGKSEGLLAHIDTIPKWSPPSSAYVIHRVKKGESLSVIARNYRTTTSKIARANNIKVNGIIRVGQKLKVPATGASAGSTYAASSATLLPGSKYKVQKGDSLWRIAQKFNTKTEKIKQINKLTGTHLSVGQILVIPQ